MNQLMRRLKRARKRYMPINNKCEIHINRTSEFTGDTYLGVCHICDSIFSEDRLTKCGICDQLTCEECFSSVFGVCGNCHADKSPEEIMKSGARGRLKEDQAAILKMLKSADAGYPKEMTLADLKGKLGTPEDRFEEAAGFLENEGFVFRIFRSAGLGRSPSGKITAEGAEMISITADGIYVLEKGRRPVRKPCYIHPEIEQRFVCEECDRPICKGCWVGFGGRDLCINCVRPESAQARAGLDEWKKKASADAQIGPSSEQMEKWKKAAEELKKMAEKYEKKMKDAGADS